MWKLSINYLTRPENELETDLHTRSFFLLAYYPVRMVAGFFTGAFLWGIAGWQ
jgi:hypothetical protein